MSDQAKAYADMGRGWELLKKHLLEKIATRQKLVFRGGWLRSDDVDTDKRYEAYAEAHAYRDIIKHVEGTIKRAREEARKGEKQ